MSEDNEKESKPDEGRDVTPGTQSKMKKAQCEYRVEYNLKDSRQEDERCLTYGKK